MNIDTMTQLISTIGFPIAVCLICFWYINKQNEDQKEQIEKLSEAVNNNTLVMEKIMVKLGEERSVYNESKI